MNIDKNKVKLIFPSTNVFGSYIAALHEGFRRGIGETKTEDEIQNIENDFETYIKSLNAPPDGTFKAPNGEEFEKVPYETLWLVCDDIFIGEVSFRHELNGFLHEYGGHVGYGIRPSLEGLGFGTLALKLTKERAAQRGMDKLLITCDPDHTASEKIILRNGGVHENTPENPYGCGPVKRFWMPTMN